jgi:four helix bundle protein
MPSIQKIEDIKAWQLARNFAHEIFHVYNQEPFARDFGLKDQLNRSSGSIMDNIAEGYGRLGNKEFINFLTYAKGSCLEAKSQLIRAFDREYITNDQLEYFDKQLTSIDNHIGGFIAYLKKTDYKGQKFKEPPAPYNPT